MIRVLVVDDLPFVRSAVVDLLRSADGVSAVGEAGSGEEALDLATKVQPDVVLMDISMPGMSGIEATRRLADELIGLRVLMFSAEINFDLVHAAREAGAAGFVAKGCRGTQILRAIRAVSDGRLAWPVHS